MIEFSFTTRIYTDELRQELKERTKLAQRRLDQQILTDSNNFVPKDSGMLRDSGILDTVIGSGIIRWTTPYAAEQYYGNYDHSKQKNPNGQRLWFEAAKARYLENWKRLVYATITGH